jgi:hypothetical protein
MTSCYLILQLWSTRTSCIYSRLVWKEEKESLPMRPWLPLSFFISSYHCFYNTSPGGARTHLHHRQSRLGRGRWRMPQCWRLLMKMLRALSGKSPSSRVNLQRHAELRRWLWRSSAVCPMRRLMVGSSWWSLRWSIRSSTRSFPFYELGAPSCVLPLLAHHG